MLRYALFLLAIGAVLAGCKDNISTLGSQFYTDTVGIHTSVRSDTGFIRFADTLRPFVSTGSADYALTDQTDLVLIGRVSSGTENLESWGLLQFPSLTADSIPMVTSVRLLLKDFAYKYGDTTNVNVAFNVWTCYNKVTDSTTSIAQSDLSASAIGTIDTAFPDTTSYVLPIALDPTATKAVLNESNNAFVITPQSTMTNVRAFGSLRNSNVNLVPQLQIVLNDTDTIYRTPVISFHLVHDNSMTPAGEFTLRGGAGQREHITLNIAELVDSGILDQFSSVNNATLVLHMDPNSSRLPTSQSDAIGPDIVSLGTQDSGAHLLGYGYLSDSLNMIYRFQVRALVEDWLRNPSLNLGFELRSEFVTRAFGTETIGVEDNTLNRWSFYGPNCADTSKRPYLILSYSKLR